jgi:PBP1b-binding outer membrane lipoprotein LpoB
MKSKALAMILTACMIFGCLAGCSSSVQNYNGTDSTATPAPTDTAADTRDYAAIRDKYPLDTVVMTVNGSEVTWGEYFYWLYYTITYAEQYVGVINEGLVP